MPRGNHQTSAGYEINKTKNTKQDPSIKTKGLTGIKSSTRTSYILTNPNTEVDEVSLSSTYWLKV
jgi:hypothetical protein